MTAAIRAHILRGDVMMREGTGNAKSVGFLHRLVDPVRSRSSDQVSMKTTVVENSDLLSIGTRPFAFRLIQQYTTLCFTLFVAQ